MVSFTQTVLQAHGGEAGPTSSQARGLGEAMAELETNTVTREAGGSGQAINRASEPKERCVWRPQWTLVRAVKAVKAY